ncbi:MAG: hypothetical protein AB1798_09680 [Spirochaetota bacterium]
MLDNGKLGIGIVGLGLVANEHIRGYLANPQCEIAAFVSRDKERAKLMAGRLAMCFLPIVNTCMGILNGMNLSGAGSGKNRWAEVL